VSGLLERAARFLIAPDDARSRPDRQSEPADDSRRPQASSGPPGPDGHPTDHVRTGARRGRTIVSALPPTPRVVVLGRPQDVRPLAASLALVLRASERSPSGLVATWGVEEPPVRGTATRSAARLAARLALRDLAAVARGRLAWLELPEEPAEATAAVHAVAAVVDGPVVTALAGPRPPALEPLIDDHDLAVVAADPASSLACAALDALAGRSVPAVACRPVPRGLARALATAGMLPPRLDRPAAEGGA
jgi:hypothetical protein